ncbi:MAG: hypothetical protein R3C60_06350 [Parvularculaceae bacterium]
MSEETKIELTVEAERLAIDIFECSLALARRRLKSIGKDEIEQTVEFDRAARTALTLVHVAAGVDALTARKRKELEANDKDGGEAGAEYQRYEAEIVGRLARHFDGRASGASAVGSRSNQGDGGADQKSGRTAS